MAILARNPKKPKSQHRVNTDTIIRTRRNPTPIRFRAKKRTNYHGSNDGHDPNPRPENAATDSNPIRPLRYDAKRPLFPIESGHRIRLNPATLILVMDNLTSLPRLRRSRPVIPIDPDHLFRRIATILYEGTLTAVVSRPRSVSLPSGSARANS